MTILSSGNVEEWSCTLRVYNTGYFGSVMYQAITHVTRKKTKRGKATFITSLHPFSSSSSTGLLEKVEESSGTRYSDTCIESESEMILKR